MSWRINTTDISSFRLVISPDGVNSVILFNPKQAIGNASVNYTNRVRDIGNVSLGTVSFRLLNLTVADAGRYVYKSIAGSDAGGQVLVIAGVPANVSIMEMADPFENKTYTVQCSAKPTSIPPDMGLTMHYQWKNEKGQNITASDRYSFSSDQSNLIINPLKRQDAGIFVCEARELVGAVSQSGPFSLKVYYGPDPGSMILSPNKTSHELAEASSLSVSCSTDCFPDCQYRWTGPGGSSPSNTGLLSIISIGRNQTGQYICTGSNSKIPDKTATATVNVVVFYGPDDGNVSLSPGNTSYQLRELSPLAVQCVATCVPQCDYQWSGPRVSQNDRLGLLSISQISRNQSGTFTCTVINPRIPGNLATANFSVIVYYGPDTNGLTLFPSNTSYQLTELSSLTAKCSTTCVPQCNYQWMGPGISRIDNNGLLFVSQISRNQTGTFTCTVTNPMIPGKSATANISVTVYYPPVLTMKATNSSVGYRVVINCSASGVPDDYTFFNWTHMAPDESRTIVRELEVTRVSGSKVSFTIEGATYQDTGFYICKASNGIAHYTTGQLIMEDMVSLWITDQPIITSNVRYFAAEKGKSGQMYVEFYAGVIQPIVSWFRLKNGMMEMLQNSSNIGIFLSTLIVELKYYQKTVRLQGYNASLEVFDVQDEVFTSYKVEIYSSFAEPVYKILELKLRGPPETPTNFHVVLESITTHSLQLTWRAGFHGGASQTFVIQYRIAGDPYWLIKSEHNQLVQYVTLNTTITDLKEGTLYEFRIYSENTFNRSQISPTVNETTKTAGGSKASSSTDTVGNANQTTLIVSAILFCLAACLFTAALVLYIHIRKNLCTGCKSDTSKMDPKISDIRLCQPMDIDGVSNLQVAVGRETSYPYEDLSNLTRSAPEYEELSKGSAKQSKSGNHLYSNIVNSSSM